MTEPFDLESPLVQVVGLTTHGPAHPDPTLLQVAVRYDPSVDVGTVFLRVATAVATLDRELRDERLVFGDRETS